MKFEPVQLAMTLKTRATIEDLYREPGKAELVDGEIIRMSATGIGPGFAAGEIFAYLREYARRTKVGIAVSDNNAFRVNLSGRGSFSPDAAFVLGPVRFSMKFFDGAPAFAVEVRSEGDYGPAADKAIAAKRSDYFAAGTLVVWDVNLMSKDVVRVYRATDPDQPVVYRKGDIAEAEPAVPGWTMEVDALFL